MYHIHFNGYLECEDTEAFQIAFQQFLQTTQGTFYGNLLPEKLPDYVDYQKIEDADEGNIYTDIQSENRDNSGE